MLDDLDESWVADSHVKALSRRVEPDGVRFARDSDGVELFAGGQVNDDHASPVTSDEGPAAVAIQVKSVWPSRGDRPRVGDGSG